MGMMWCGGRSENFWESPKNIFAKKCSVCDQNESILAKNRIASYPIFFTPKTLVLDPASLRNFFAKMFFGDSQKFSEKLLCVLFYAAISLTIPLTNDSNYLPLYSPEILGSLGMRYFKSC